MTTEILDRAEISGDNVIVEYSATEAALAELRQKYSGIVFDLTTTKGDKEARAARLELITLRTSLEKKRKQFKAPALEFGKKIDSEATRVTTEILVLETPIDDQIKADEKRRADEKSERERIAAERAQGFRDRIASIRAFVTKCQGITSERIANGIALVEQIDVSAMAFEEFAVEAAAAKDETLASMRQIMAETKAREEEAARVEAQRVENERVAAEQKKQADALAAQQAEIDRQAQELKKAQEAQAEQDRIRKEEQDRIAREAAAAAAAKPAVHANGAPMFSTTTFKENGDPIMLDDQGKRSVFCDVDEGSESAPVVPATAANVVPMRTASRPAPATPPTLKLGQISERLGFSLTGDFLKSLGFEPAACDKAALLFHEATFPFICAALIDHIGQVRAKQAA